MCDYSLESVRSREAKIGDTIVSSSFKLTSTRGFTGVGEPGVAVCMVPGKSAVIFDRQPVVMRRSIVGQPIGAMDTVQLSRNAEFIQVDLHDPFRHHDALRFADGSIVKVSVLPLDLRATVVAVTEDAVKKLLADANAAVAELPIKGDVPAVDEEGGITREVEPA